jgi:hypothetical protein
MDPGTGLDNVKKRISLNPPELELRALGRPARSQSPYRLLYDYSTVHNSLFLIFIASEHKISIILISSEDVNYFTANKKI